MASSLTYKSRLPAPTLTPFCFGRPTTFGKITLGVKLSSSAKPAFICPVPLSALKKLFCDWRSTLDGWHGVTEELLKMSDSDKKAQTKHFRSCQDLVRGRFYQWRAAEDVVHVRFIAHPLLGNSKSQAKALLGVVQCICQKMPYTKKRVTRIRRIWTGSQQGH